MTEPAKEVKTPAIPFSKFLESTPPGTTTNIGDLAHKRTFPGGYQLTLRNPELRLTCENEACGGLRVFRADDRPDLALNRTSQTFLKYECSNCAKNVKVFALTVHPTDLNGGGLVYKYGEFPPFGPSTPPRLLKLIGPDADLFLKGRRCENQGLGVGAFAYYRRLVTNQKERILAQIEAVAIKVGAPEATLKALAQAKKAWQFEKSIDAIKDAIPQSLLIDGHNPLVLLHKALSDGLHDGTDEQCLEAAQAIRLVLAELAERLDQALKEEAELKAAVSRLLQKKSTTP